MAKLNKLITTSAVELSEDEQAVLAQTLYSVITAVGGGSGGEGKTYTGTKYIEVNNGTLQPTIALKQDAVSIIEGVSASAVYWNDVYETVDENELDWNGAVDTLSAYSGTWLTEDDITGKQDALTNEQLSAISSVSGKQDTLVFGYDENNKISGINNSGIAQPDVSNFLTKASADNDYQVKGNYILSGSFETGKLYGYGLNGWGIITTGEGPTGGLAAVSHDGTMSGDGRSTNPLGVAWSGLSGNTIASANSATVASFYSDGDEQIYISAAINNILNNGLTTAGIMPDNGISGVYNSQGQAFELGLTQTAYNAVTSVSSKLDATAAAETYQTIAGMASYLTTTDAAATYQLKGTYLSTILVSDDAGLSGDGINTGLGVSLTAVASAQKAGNLTNAQGTVVSSFDAITDAIASKLYSSAIKTATYGGTDYVSGINNVPIKGANFNACTTTAVGDTWQQYIEGTNTFNYYKVKVHPAGTTPDGWTNDGIIHIILEA